MYKLNYTGDDKITKALCRNNNELLNTDMGSGVNLSSYSSSSQYTCPSHGYVYVKAESTGSATVTVNGTIKISADYSSIRYASLYVRQGAKLYADISSNGVATFYPLVEEE